MKILVVASLMPYATANYLIHALVEAGHDVLTCSDVNNPQATVCVKGRIDVAEFCKQRGESFDLVLFVEGGSMRLFPVGLEKINCLSAWYGIDTHMDYAKHLKIGRLFDVTFVAQKEYVERLKQDGLKQVFWLPLAFAHELHPQSECERKYNVAYVGSDNAKMHPVRHQLLNLIKEKVANVWIGKAEPLQMARIYAESKIVFNKSVNNDVNMRYFEAMGAGAVLVTDHAVSNGVEELFTTGVHFLEYEDADSLKKLIQELVAQPEEIERIGHCARQHVLENHTYSHRAKELLQRLGVCTKLAKPGPEDYFSVFVSLRMANEALLAVEQSFDWKNSGAAQKVISCMIRSAIKGLRAIVSVSEHFKLCLSDARR